jgi:hypothetical protein
VCEQPVKLADRGAAGPGHGLGQAPAIAEKIAELAAMSPAAPGV